MTSPNSLNITLCNERTNGGWAVVFAQLIVLVVLIGAGACRAQSPVDSSWTLDHGDTLLFHHDNTREFVRANGNREVRFPDGRRLHFFTPDRFIEKRTFAARNFEEMNSVNTPTRTLFRFKLAAGFGAVTIAWTSFPDGEAQMINLPPTKNREYRFSLPFEEPGWHIVEISANGPDRVRRFLARILVCVGDHLPLPFDTVVERHGPDLMPRTNDRVCTFLTFDRNREGAALEHDTARDEAASLLVTSAVTLKMGWALITPQHARQLLGPMANSCDTTLRAVAIAAGHTPEAIAWNLWTSPTHRSMGILKKAARVAVGIMRMGMDVTAAILLEGRK